MTKTILVFGGLGMAGHMIVNYLKGLNKYNIYNTVSKNKLDESSIVLNALDIKEVKEAINSIKPDIIINCIGILNGKSDLNVEKTSYINSFFPKILENIGINSNMKIIHLSTDCVFSGYKGGYIEDDTKDANDVYGISKSIGEIINKKDLTFRTSIIGPELKENGSGLFHWFMNQNTDIYGYTSVFWSGVTTLELAKAIDKAIEENLCGLYQLVYDFKISKYDLLNIIKDEFNRDINIIHYDEKVSDKSMINTRSDFSFKVKSYNQMIREMRDYMIENKGIYSQYFKQ